MAKKPNIFRRTLVALGLSLGIMTALPGCSGQKTEAQMLEEYAEDLNDFTDAFKNNDSETMKKEYSEVKKEYLKACKDVKKASKKLKKAQKKAKKKNVSNLQDLQDDLEQKQQKQVVLKYVKEAMEFAEKQSKDNSNDTLSEPGLLGIAKDLFGKGAEAVGDFAGKVQYDIAAKQISEYAKTHPEYQKLAVEINELRNEAYQKAGIDPRPVSDLVFDAAGNLIENVTEKAEEAKEAVENEAAKQAEKFNNYVEENHLFDEVSSEGATGEAKATPKTSNSRNKEFKKKYNYVPAVNACIAQIDGENGLEKVNPNLEQVYEDRIQEDKEAKEKAAREKAAIVAQATNDDSRV